MLTKTKSIGIFVFAAPFLIIWIIAQVPFSLVEAAAKGRREKRFTAAMRAAGRVVSWPDACVQVEGKHGTFVGELVSSDGYRLWWTPEYIPDVCPHPCRFGDDEPSRLSGHTVSDEWCRSRFTSPNSGAALLVVDVPRSNWQQWMDYMAQRAADQRYVLIRTN